MSRTKRIYNRIPLFYNKILNAFEVYPYLRYKQYCMGNCRTCKKWKIKEMRKDIQYHNEYYHEQIQEVL